ncbi:MAG: polyprenyl synthetase [Candidatus Nanohalarchaeota archaeon]|nr:MAG: polyprenyl synthetase [Candidatus Nanohaloarchaeota archaeon]
MYELLGKIIVYCVWIAVVLVTLSLFVGYIALKRRVVLYSFSADVLDFFYMPLKTIYARFGNTKKLDAIMVGLKNMTSEEKYAETKNRILLAPHCMRSLDCPAYSARDGIQCKSCGKCVFTDIKKTAEDLGIRLYILTGSSAVKYVVKRDKFDGILLLACDYELNKVMRSLAPLDVPVYGVPLTKDGCYNTEADVEALYSAMKMGLNK